MSAGSGRQSARLRQRCPLRWAIDALQLAGSGEIHDLSASGLAFQIDREFPIPRDTRYLFTLASPEIPALPPQALLRWFRQPRRHRGDPVLGFLCGATFKLDDRAVAAAWTEWITAALAAADRRPR